MKISAKIQFLPVNLTDVDTSSTLSSSSIWKKESYRKILSCFGCNMFSKETPCPDTHSDGVSFMNQIHDLFLHKTDVHSRLWVDLRVCLCVSVFCLHLCKALEEIWKRANKSNPVMGKSVSNRLRIKSHSCILFPPWWPSVRINHLSGSFIVQIIINIYTKLVFHDDVIKWKHFPRYWPFVRGIHRWPVNSPHKGQWRRALMFSFICALNKRMSKQLLGWWFETPSRSLWRHCNVVVVCLEQAADRIVMSHYRPVVDAPCWCEGTANPSVWDGVVASSGLCKEHKISVKHTK